MVDEQTPFALFGTRGRGARPRMDALRHPDVRVRLHPGAALSPSTTSRLPRRADDGLPGHLAQRMVGLNTLGCCCCCRAAKMEEASTRFKGD